MSIYQYLTFVSDMQVLDVEVSSKQMSRTLDVSDSEVSDRLRSPSRGNVVLDVSDTSWTLKGGILDV